MLLMYLMYMIIFIICNLLMMLTMILSKKSYKDREKSSPFECGFDPKSSARIPFSLHFFLITVIFLIFDVEIALIFPMILSFLNTNIKYWMMTSLFFCMILILGVFHEWNMKMLEWTN
uniref:NADH dehydrogenase subunit 3 n=1 Tax=Coptotriche turpinia TaxID=2984363 RepID=UPI00223744B1|nr:NADH dehydrogenase subunit 3 [Coptotriche turpinia]UYB79009.1 NADH dehydrogenase subunit 3 [Coptotriche turpinia]